jgi:hypothetical protein
MNGTQYWDRLSSVSALSIIAPVDFLRLLSVRQFGIDGKQASAVRRQGLRKISGIRRW